MVLEAMASQKKGGLKFKQNFLVSVLTLLEGTGPQSGFVDQSCLHNLDVRNINRKDLCTYIPNHLNERRKTWKGLTNSKKTTFIGSLPLLVFFKVHSTRGVTEYKLPAITYWTTDLLATKEKDLNDGDYVILPTETKSEAVYIK